MKNIAILICIFFWACKSEPLQEQQVEEVKFEIPQWTSYNQSAEIAANTDHESQRLRYKLIQSKNLDKNQIWATIAPQLQGFSEEEYQKLRPLIFEQDIPTLQSSIAEGKLTYQKLTQWFLYRIVKFENDREKMLNAIISINPNAVAEAKQKDETRSPKNHPIFGMPILLKDNVNVAGIPTTAGAHSLMNNLASDAFIVERIKENGGIVLGKANLSEWANYNCNGCPNGFSAVGGQTLNPYGRKKLDTGGSSSGSGVSMAASYAVAAVGSETSGSILSPSSSNSLVGLKPTIGLLSRGGIVPISSTLDTPGPMTRNVVDNAILLSAMTGEDPKDATTSKAPKGIDYLTELKNQSLEGIRFGVNKSFLEEDSIYKAMVEKIASLGGEMIEFEPAELQLEGFGELLDADMRLDLASYLENYASEAISFKSVDDIVAYNKADSLVRIPYGQGRFAGILETKLTPEEHKALKEKLEKTGRQFFEVPIQAHNLDVVLSINNWNAGFAAAAKYPCLTVPMGYWDNGRPMGLTFIGRQFEEEKLLKLGYAFEQATKVRETPKGYE